MEYKLKMSTSRAIVSSILLLLVLVLAVFLAFESFADPAMLIAFDLMDVELIIAGIVFVLAVFVSFYGMILNYNFTVRPLTFNNISFTYKGKTYTYQQIEKMNLVGERFGGVSYQIYVDGKKIYTFDKDFEGAKEFFYYLDFYKVPGTPRI